MQLILDADLQLYTSLTHHLGHDYAAAVLQAAGAYGMCTLYGVMPPLMAWNFRHGKSTASAGGLSDASAGAPHREVAGGRAALVALCGAAVGVVSGQSAIDLGWLHIG